MIKEILYCKKFEFKDQFLSNLLGGHPKTGHLYRVETDEKGVKRILLEKDGVEQLLFISGEKGEDLRYSFEFVKFKPSTIFDEMRIPLDRDGSGTLQDAYFSFSLQPIRDNTGEVYGMMAIAVDITV